MRFIRGILQRVTPAIQKGFAALLGFARWLWSRLLNGLAALGRLLIALVGWIKAIPNRLRLLWDKAKSYVPNFLIACTVLFVFWLILFGYSYEWTGLGIATFTGNQGEEIRQPKRLWDWLELLVIPLVLAISAALFSRAERRNEQVIAAQRLDEERRIADKRIEEERKIAEDRAQEATLQSYFEQMSIFLIDKELRKSEEGADVRDLARAWTLTFLRRLRGERKGILLRFLHEAALIQDDPIISLSGADLSGADLSGVRFMNIPIPFILKQSDPSNLHGAKYTTTTKWPDGFDPASHGAILIEEI